MNDDLVLTQEVYAPPAKPPFAVASIILSMGLLAIGSGLAFAYIPTRLAQLGFDPEWAGWIMTSVALGGFVGCVTAGILVRRVGHARTFMASAALGILGHLLMAVSQDPWVWLVARMGYGFAITNLFISSQSWLNDASPNEWRGRVVATFYMTYVVCIGLGGYLIAWIDLSGPTGPILAAAFSAVAIIPVGLTNLQPPPPPQSVAVAFRAVWNISPVGLAGLLAVGGLTMLIQGFAPIYAAATGYSQGDIGLLLFLMQFGMIAVQLPLGALSDRIDRRYVLILSTLLIIGFATASTQADGASVWILIVLFGAWAGATETIYAVANAHANDRAQPEYYVSLSMTMLFAWSVSGFLVPGITTAIMPFVGVKAFMYLAIGIAAVYALFILFRIMQRTPVAAEDQVPYEPRAAQAAYLPELSAPPTDDVEQKRF